MKFSSLFLKISLLAGFLPLLTSCSKEEETIPSSKAVVSDRYLDTDCSGTLLNRGAANDPLYWVRLLVQNIQPADNFYNTQADSVTWTGQQGAIAYYCSTDCSGMFTKLLKQSYGYSDTYFKTWTGLANPYAYTYYNEIVKRDHFTRISKISGIAAGDIIAMKYPSGSTSTGHIMIADGPAVLRTSTAPLITGTVQYEIPVNDCSSSGHGSLDTRYNNGNWDDGVGRGIFRIYADSRGNMLGYTWSTFSNSVYYSQSQRPLAVGRHIP